MGQILRVLCSGICTTLLWLAFHSDANAKPFEVPVSPEELKPNKRPIGVFTDATINLSQGLYSTSYPIQVPPGRNGLTPSLALEYNSTSERSTIGIGWDLPLDHVRRSLRSGTPGYVGPGSTDEDELEFRLGQYTGTLVRVLDENGLPLYRPKIEGAFAKFYYNLVSDSWVVQDRSGRTWYLGGDGAKDYDPESPDRTFAWYVKRVVDPQHNMIEYTYEAAGGNLYLTNVDYDLKESTPRPTYYPHLVLNWNISCLGTQAISYRKGFRSDLDAGFLSSIEVHAYNQDGSTEQTRSYTLQPGWEEQPGGQVVVRSVAPQSLPTATFTYHAPTIAWNTRRDLANTAAVAYGALEDRYLELTREWVDDDDNVHYATTAMLVDIDGDGDLDQLLEVNGGRWRKNTGWGFESGNSMVGGSATSAIDLAGWRHTIRNEDGDAYRTYQDVFDIDGDGKADWVRAHQGQLEVYRGDGFGNFGVQGCEIWNASGPYVENIAASYVEVATYDQAGFLDMDGDGLPDFVIVDGNGASTEHLRVYRNLGRAPGGSARGLDPNYLMIDMPESFDGHTGIRASTTWINPLGGYTWGWHYWDLRDMNGDGLVDLITGSSDPQQGHEVRYGKGPHGTPHSYFDMLGDPFYNNAGWTQFSFTASLPSPRWGSVQWETVGLYDLDGDGLLDVVSNDRSTEWKFRKNNGRLFEDETSLGDSAYQTGMWYTAINLTETWWYQPYQIMVTGVMQRVMDFNGDGRVELVRSCLEEPEQTCTGWRALTAPDNAQPAYLLKKVQSGVAKDEVTYRWPEQGPQSSPHRRWTVGTLTKTDVATGEIRTTSVDARHPSYDPSLREFHGHKYVRITDGEWPAVRYREHEFHIDEFNHGTERRSDISDSGFTYETPTRRVETSYDEISLDGGTRKWVTPNTVTTTIHDQGSTTITEEEYDYPNDELPRSLGLVSSITKKGLLSSPSDYDRKTSYTYFIHNNASERPSSSNPLVTRPYTETVESLLAVPVQASKTIHLYDGLCSAVAKDPSALPPPGASPYFTAGQPCQEWTWQHDDVYGIQEELRDAHGRVYRQIDPDGVRLDTVYYGDTPYVRYQYNNLGHQTWFMRYHALSGSAGRVCGPDHSGAPATDNCDDFAFDLYGRPISVARDYDRGTPISQAPTETTIYSEGFWSTPASVADTRYPDRYGLQPTQTKKVYFNRWGQVVHEVSKIEENKYQARHFKYNQLGQLERAWLSYETTSDAFEITPPDDPRHQYYTYVHDVLDRPTQSTHKNGDHVTIAYSGPAMTVTDESLKTTTYQQNGFGEVVSIQRAAGAPSSTFEYDAAGRVTRATDENQGVYSYTYNGDGTLQSTALPSGSFVYERSPSGRLTHREAENGYLSSDYTYDQIGRLATRTVWSSPTPLVYTYSYDQQTWNTGKLTTTSSSEFNKLLDYDALGNVSNKTLLETGGRTLSLSAMSTPFGAPLQLTYPSGRVVRYNYDSAGNTSAVSSDPHPDGRFSVAVQHLPGGRPESVNGAFDGGGSPLDFTRGLEYDERHRLTRLVTTGPTTWDVGRTYHANGRVSSLSDNLRGVPWLYTYDAANRLESAVGTNVIGYAYKDNGALSTVTTDGHTETYAYSDSRMHQLQSVTSSARTLNAVFDEAGLLDTLSDPGANGFGRNYTFNGDGMLAVVSHHDNGGPVTFFSYDYDEDGTRWRRRRMIWPTTDADDFYLDGVAEIRGQGAGEELIEYVRIPYATIELRDTGEHKVSFSDGLNTGLVVDDQGTIDHLSSYRPYGEKQVLYGSLTTTFNFNEKRREAEIETLYYGARYYDTALRQFVSVDPLRLDGVKDVVDRHNLLQPYVYAASDPVTFADDGHEMTAQQIMHMDPNLNAYMADQVAQGIAYPLYHVVPGADALHGVIFGRTYSEARAGVEPSGNRATYAARWLGEVALAYATWGAARGSAPAPVPAPKAPVLQQAGRGTGAATQAAEAGASRVTPAMQQMLGAMSKGNLKHSIKHLEQFQKLDPSMTAEGLRELGARIATTPGNLISEAGAARQVFQQVVEIGGNPTTVRSVLNEAGTLNSIHIRW